MRNIPLMPRKILVLMAMGAGLAVAAGCASTDFGKFDHDGDGFVSQKEADGRIDYFDSYDKNNDGSLDPEEFKWAYSATKHRRDKERGTADLPPSDRPKGGSDIIGGAGGFGR